ncbi:MAG: alpha/beta hydrolase [Planctomycetota bacterium]|jgi:acetyl esterase/lipase
MPAQQIHPRRLHATCLCFLTTSILAGAIASRAQAQLQRPLEPIAAKLEPTRTVVYKQIGDRELHLHIFEPDGHKSNDRRPAFLTIHGGGWTGGNARRFYPIADWFRQKGFLGISLEYRLLNAKTKTAVFDCVKDGRSAVRYLRSHAAELGIDPQKIVVSGGSAGGHVAAGTALFTNLNEDTDDLAVSPRPNVLVLFYPVIDTSAKGYGQKKIGDRWQEISPVHHVREGLPPTLLLHGTGDTVTPYAGATSFFDQMRAAGNLCKLISHEGGRHGYFIFDLQLYEEAMQQTLTFLQTQQIVDHQSKGPTGRP